MKTSRYPQPRGLAAVSLFLIKLFLFLLALGGVANLASTPFILFMQSDNGAVASIGIRIVSAVFVALAGGMQIWAAITWLAEEGKSPMTVTVRRRQSVYVLIVAIPATMIASAISSVFIG